MTRAILAALLLPGIAAAQGVPPAQPVEPVTAEDVASLTPGEDFTFNRLVITEARPNEDGIILSGSRIRGAQTGANSWIQFTADSYWWFGQPIKNCTGCVLLTDGLSSSASGVPVTVYETKGFKVYCKASLDTCNASLGEGTVQCLLATPTSRTRYCTCTSDGAGSPAYAWALNGGAGAVGTSSTCPEVTP